MPDKPQTVAPSTTMPANSIAKPTALTHRSGRLLVMRSNTAPNTARSRPPEPRTRVVGLTRRGASGKDPYRGELHQLEHRFPPLAAATVAAVCASLPGLEPGTSRDGCSRDGRTTHELERLHPTRSDRSER
jgi:hypothetical protein